MQKDLKLMLLQVRDGVVFCANERLFEVRRAGTRGVRRLIDYVVSPARIADGRRRTGSHIVLSWRLSPVRFRLSVSFALRPHRCPSEGQLRAVCRTIGL